MSDAPKPMVELRRRQYKDLTAAPVAFPAWRVWEDRRVRLDDAVMAMLAAMRVARVGVEDRREHSQADLVSDLYSDEEVEHRHGFRVTFDEAERRWAAGEQELARTSLVLGVAALDDLLAGAIGLLREHGHDRTEAGRVDTGMSAKLTHLVDHGGLPLSSGARGLHALLLAMRNAIVHESSRQGDARRAWKRLDDEEQQWWQQQAGRELVIADEEAELDLADGEVLAVFKVLDRVAIEVNAALLDVLGDERWARMVAEEYRALEPGKVADPRVRLERTVRHAERAWRLTGIEQAIATALGA